MERLSLTRASAHQYLSEVAHGLRLDRPGMSVADAFELACLRAPTEARHLHDDLDLRASRGHEPDRHETNRKTDDLGQRVREQVLGPDGKTDPAKLKRFALANGCWLPKYDGMSAGSQMAAVLSKLRWRAGQGQQLVFPA